MIKYKKRQNFSIDIKVSDKFKKICNDKSINMSNLIEKFMIQYIENNSQTFVTLRLSQVIHDTLSCGDESLYRGVWPERHRFYLLEESEVSLSGKEFGYSIRSVLRFFFRHLVCHCRPESPGILFVFGAYFLAQDGYESLCPDARHELGS